MKRIECEGVGDNDGFFEIEQQVGGRVEPVVSVQMTENTADALHRLLSNISLNRMRELGLSYEQACLVSQLKPALY